MDLSPLGGSCVSHKQAVAKKGGFIWFVTAFSSRAQWMPMMRARSKSMSKETCW